MDKPFLTRPTMAYKTSFIAAKREALDQDGTKPSWNFHALENHFDEYVAMYLARTTDPFPGQVPQTDFWLVAQDIYVGSIGIRHKLTPELLQFGGHIGYDIRPSMRRKGYGTLQCRLALVEARQLGLKRVLITCDEDNIGSRKIIEANGGILENKADNKRSVLTRRYWIDLAKI